MLNINIEEKEKAIENSYNFFQGDDGKLLFKVLVNYLGTTTELYSILKDVDDTIFDNKEAFKKYSKLIISYMANLAMEAPSTKVYTTGDLSMYFGVSVATINNWINEGRFIGLPKKQKHKQMRISENTKWRSRTGRLRTVKEVADTYEPVSFTEGERIEEMKSSVVFFENKYGGKYENSLKLKVDKSHQDEANESEWLYLLRELKEIDEL